MEEHNRLRFPFDFKEIEPEEKAENKRLFNYPHIDWIRVGPKRYVMPRSYTEQAENIYNLPIRSSDVYVASYQRAGTTWTQELVWLLANNFDYETALSVPITHRYPFLEIYMLYTEWRKNCLKNIDQVESIEKKEKLLKMLEVMAQPVTEKLAAMPSPRYIKTHLPMSFLPPTIVDTAKMVYIARDARDIAVSSYHHAKLFRVFDFAGEFKDFWELFMKDRFVLTPYFEHVKEAWDMRHHPNMLFLFYEELAKDLPAVVRRVADFLGKEVTEKQMTDLCDHLSFENFKKNKSVNYEDLREFGICFPNETFIRKEMGKEIGVTRLPYEFEELKAEEKKELARFYASEPDFVSIGPKKYLFLRPYCEDAENVYNMPLRSSDIFVATYQRSGTTWTQELVWLLANDLDYETAAKIPLTERFPFLELFMFFNKKWQENLLKSSKDEEKARALIEKIAKPVTGRLLSAPSPRFIKTHLPMSLLPPKLLDTAKVVYVARDPRDVVVSCFHHSKLFRVLDFPSPFKDFWNLFRRGLFTELPFFDHVKEAWDCRHHPNMLFLFYEELIQDLPAVIRRVADFLGKDLTDDQMTRLCDHLSFKNFKKNESVNFEELREYGVLSPEEDFIRKGKAGGWRSYFDMEMTQEADRWIEDNLRDTDLRFPNV